MPTWEPSLALARQECERAAIDAGALEPQNWRERMAAGVMAANGERWADTPVARNRLRVWTEECMKRKGLSA